MREILFKAKTEGGIWIEGDLIHYESGEMAILEKPFSKYGREATEIARRTNVLPETICQYTGLTDKNGNKIWENDILEWEFANIPSDYYECVWLEEECAFAFKNGNDYTNPVDCWDEYSDHFCMKVIGNIFDNPELLKGGAE